MSADDRPVAALPAPAKLNLFLRITGRRADGFHELQTVFQFIDLLDEVRLRVRYDGRIERTGEVPGVAPDADLAVRAARALKIATGTRLGADIEVVKRIPMGGGLGGGSSDAATVLHGLNGLWECRLAPDALAGIGLRLGADVPVFVHGHATWAEGVGERFTPVAVEEASYLLACPRVEVGTAGVFAAADLTRDCAPLTIRGFPSEGGRCRARDLMRAGNVCEPVVRRAHPEVDACLRWLAGIGEARMTGTGAACFALLDDPGAALAATPDVRWTTRRVQGLNESPLLGALAALEGGGRR